MFYHESGQSDRRADRMKDILKRLLCLKSILGSMYFHPRQLHKLLLLAAVLCLGSAPGFSQSLQISKYADFASQDTAFAFKDTLYLRANLPFIDATALAKNYFSITPEHNPEDSTYDGSFRSALREPYTAKLALRTLDRKYSNWKLEFELADNFGHRFARSLSLTILDSPNVIGDAIISGLIKQIGPQGFYISAQFIAVDEKTTVTEGLRTEILSEIQPGWDVWVVVHQLRDGTLVARNIVIQNRRQGGQEVEFVGRIAVKADSALIINGTRVVIISTTEIRNQHDEDTAFSNLKVGMWVKAEGTQTLDGDVRAENIRIQNRDYIGKRIRVYGVITELRPNTPGLNSLKIDNSWYEITKAARLDGFSNETITFEDLHLGEAVEISAVTRQAKPPLVDELYRIQDIETDIVESGTVLSVTGAEVQVFDTRFNLTPQTLLFDRNWNFLPRSALRPGLIVHIYGDTSAGNSIDAQRIFFIDDVRQTFVVQDSVQFVDNQAMKIADELFDFDAETRFFDQDGNAGTWQQILGSDAVQVHATLLDDGRRIADTVYENTLRAREFIFRGSLTDFLSSTIGIERYRFDLDPETRFLPPLQQSSLAIGMPLEIRARQVNGRWIARRVALQQQIDGEITLEGRIEQKDGDSFRLFGETLQFSNSPELLDEGGVQIDKDDFSVNMWVRARAVNTGGPGLLCWRLQKVAAGNDTLIVEGALSAVNPNKLSIGQIDFVILTKMTIRDAQSKDVGFSALHPGQTVRIKARLFGTMLIAIEARIVPRVAALTALESRSDSALRVAGQAFDLGENALVLAVDATPISADLLAAGQLLYVVADAYDDGAVIQRVRIVRDGTTTSVADGPRGSIAPEAFALLQSYPNPLRLSTAGVPAQITFSLPQTMPVSLKVYNILGQEVAALLAGEEFTQGTHAIHWDRRDRYGRLVPAGIYFYRLETPQVRIAKRLLILP